jgi:hypothetical protein
MVTATLDGVAPFLSALPILPAAFAGETILSVAPVARARQFAAFVPTVPVPGLLGA